MSERLELPLCRWRGSEVEPGRYHCHSPKVHVMKAGVRAESCMGCYYADHEPPEPGALEKAGNLARAAGAIAVSGFARVPEGEYERRLALCRACPWFKDEHCSKCGCKLSGDVRAKARYAAMKCPLEKWEAA